MKAEARNIMTGLVAWLAVAMAIAIASPAGATAIAQVGRGLFAGVGYSANGSAFTVDLIGDVLETWESAAGGDADQNPSVPAPFSVGAVTASAAARAESSGIGDAWARAVRSGIVRITNEGAGSAIPVLSLRMVGYTLPGISVGDPSNEYAETSWSMALSLADGGPPVAMDSNRCAVGMWAGPVVRDCAPDTGGSEVTFYGVPMMASGDHFDIAYRVEVSAYVRSEHPMHSTPKPVPEPSAALMLAAGIAALTMRKKAR